MKRVASSAFIIVLLASFALPQSQISIVSSEHGPRISGCVTEIVDGNTFLVGTDHNLQTEITLQHVDAPEQGQPYADVARQHLSDPLSGKCVLIIVNELDEDAGVTIGDVWLGQMNIGLQMVRDGVAWRNDSSDASLSDTGVALYQASESAARAERRGLWRDANPVAPWEFRRAKAAQLGLDLSGFYSDYYIHHPSSIGKSVYVRDYVRKNGTHVNSYMRSPPGTLRGGASSGGRHH